MDANEKSYLSQENLISILKQSIDLLIEALENAGTGTGFTTIDYMNEAKNNLYDALEIAESL